MPLSLGLQLTTRCNLHCTHCYQDAASGEDMSLNLIAPLFDQAKAAGCACVDFTGGEPLLHSAWPDILRMLSEKKLGFSLVTNGWKLEDFLRALGSDMPLLRRLSISLDGPDAEAHDAVRGAGSFARATGGARLCKDMGVEFSLRMTVTKASPPYLDRMLALGETLGAEALVLIPVIPTRRMAEAGLLPEPADLHSVAAWAADRKHNNGTHVVLAAGYFTLEIARPCPSFTGESLFVSAQGDICFCCQLLGDKVKSDDVLGHVAETSLVRARQRSRKLAEALVREKEAKRSAGKLGYLEYHPCWYCLKRFGRAEWLAAFPGTSWAGDVRSLSQAVS
jgi:MoaA/NifB/PqqE/SkfB family radical SAM enzyme